MLTHTDDENKAFHPVVKECLEKALKNSGLDSEYAIVMRRVLPSGKTFKEPDFLLEKKSGGVESDYVCVIEVKKTPGAVRSYRFGEQAMGYVKLLRDDWAPKYHKHFCVTNIELTRFYCSRKDNSSIGCVLAGINRPFSAGTFATDFESTKSNFIQRFEGYFQLIHEKTEPEFNNHFPAISSSLEKSYADISKILGWSTSKFSLSSDVEKESVIYELLRISFYYYIQEKYRISGWRTYFKLKKFDKLNSEGEVDLYTMVDNAFKCAMRIDFKDILENNDSPQQMFPQKLNDHGNIAEIFRRFIRVMDSNAREGIESKRNLQDYISLITSELYRDRKERRENGKVMSDEGLANVLAGFAINSTDDSVIDPSCGDGNLLLASYNRLRELKKKSLCDKIIGNGKEHNRILNQLNGFELDRNLVQLCRFKLICSNLLAVNKKTQTNIEIKDCIFVENQQFDALVMNPPFIRSKNMKQFWKQKIKGYKQHLRSLKSGKSYVQNIKSPDIYNFHIEKSVEFLKENGTAAIIVKSNFFNNQNGVAMKKFLLRHLETVIIYPNKTFFEDEAISTCILILKKKKNPKTPISFMRVNSGKLLSDVNLLKRYILEQKTFDNEELVMNHVPIGKLDIEDNWNTHFRSPKDEAIIKSIFNHSNHKKIKDVFNLERGKAGDGIHYKEQSFPFSVGVTKDEPYVKSIENHHRIFGMCNADDERHLFLTDECLSIDQGIKVPKLEDYFLRRRGLTSEYTSRTRALELYPELSILGLPELDAEDSFLSNILQSSLYDFFHKISFPLSEGKRIASSGGKREGDKLVSKKDTISHHSYSIVSPLIIIARNLRSKHAVYLNHEKNEICLSSNFYGASFDRTGYPRRHPGGSFPAKPPISDNHVKFITAYLNSVFGELSVVMQCSDREGTRKLDSYLQAENISFLNPSILLSNEVDRVIDLFQAYSDTLDFRIISKNSEDGKFWHQPPSRIELDKAISELVFKYHNPTDFDSANELLDFVVSQCGSITNSRQT